MNNKVTLFVMTKKGYRVLKSLADNFSENIACVVCSRDRNVINDYYDNIVSLCQYHDIQYIDREQFVENSSSYAIAVSWRWIIELTSTQLIVFHDSLLPKYRGFSPLVSALINQEKEVGVTVFYAADQYDCGDVIDQLKVTLEYPIKIQQAIETITDLYVSLALRTVKKISMFEYPDAVVQNENEASYSLWRDEIDYEINWSQSAQKISCFIDSVGYPYKGALTRINSTNIRILDSVLIDDVNIVNRVFGKVFLIEDGFPVVVCGKGLLKITEVVDETTKKSLLPFNRLKTRFD